uniref:Fibronectin type III domain-containing protein n=1 Tax=candidate division WOR-3 bacterium TaxID=2052148 RepID=A0A7V4E4V6_UNCW3
MFLIIFLIFQNSYFQNIKGYDTPADEGGSITLEWKIKEEFLSDTNPIKFFEIYRKEKEKEFINVGFVLSQYNTYEDKGLIDGKDYYYQIWAIREKDTLKSEIIGPIYSKAQWFNTNRLNVLIITIILFVVFLYYIEKAKKGEKLFVRKIAGLDAIDDAVGRATEMGRPILFSFGLGVITDVVTIAALSILSKIAKKCAEYGTRLLIPNYDPIVMAAAQETVKEAYLEANRPDLYKESDITYLTSDQFGYAAGCDGIILREKPGAIFWQGYFFAESLILAETGHSVGAIQIAGTTAITQLPFFIAACDYTLIGEEMFAASCYLKPEPHMLGSLKGEDFLKAIILVIFVVSTLIATLAVIFKDFTFINNLFQFINNIFTVK